MYEARPEDVETARHVARQALDRGHRIITRILLGALMLGIAAAGWLAIETAAAAQLQHSGRHAFARVTNVFDTKSGAGITVVYAASPVYVSIPLWFGTGSYRDGERVRISYDRSHPSHAVIANGLPAPGGIQGIPFFLLITAAVLVGCCLFGRRLGRVLPQQIAGEPEVMSVSATPIETSDDVALSLERDASQLYRLGRKPAEKWPVDTVQAFVFGEFKPKQRVIVSVPQRATALIWSVPKVPPGARDRDSAPHEPPQP